MSVVRGVLIRTFGRPKGVLGRLGGIVMARTNQTCAAWVIDLLAIHRNDKVLEVGFGPGVGIRLLAGLASAGNVAGVDALEKWFSKLQRGTRTSSRVVVSICDTAL